MTARHQRRIARRLLSLLLACGGVLLIVSNALPGIWYELTRSRTLAVSAGTPSLVAGPRQPPAPSGRPAHWPYATLDGQTPLVIGHRGAPGLYPEHTLAGYLAAIRDGADCIEPDLVMTRDGVLVARHDIYLSTTTDVAARPELAARKRKGPDIGYAGMEDWYVSDFTLAELATLRAIQPFAGRSPAFDGLYTVPTFEAVLDIALQNHARSGAPVCVYPEAKWPAYFDSLGFDMGGEILRVLKAKGLATSGSPIYIQSFDPLFLKAMAARTRLPLVLLVMTRCDLEAAMKIEGAPFWSVLGTRHQMLFDWRGKPTSIIRDAHLQGIAVHSWTYRDDAPFWGEDVETSMKRVLALGLDGFFTDFPFTGYRLVNETKSRL